MENLTKISPEQIATIIKLVNAQITIPATFKLGIHLIDKPTYFNEDVQEEVYCHTRFLSQTISFEDEMALQITTTLNAMFEKYPDYTILSYGFMGIYTGQQAHPETPNEVVDISWVLYSKSIKIG